MPPNAVPLPLPSASSVAATSSTGTHVLKLNGYSQSKLLLDSGILIESSEFKAAGHSWRIRVYPNGASSDCRPGSMSLYLVLSGRSEDKVRADFRFSFVRHGKLTVTPHDCIIISKPVTFEGDMCTWGFDNVRTKELLEDAEYFKDDAIIIRCDITMLNKPVVKRRCPDMSELLCDCNDELCVNLHAADTKATAASRKPQSHFVPNHTHTGYLPLSNHAPPLPSASAIVVTASTGCHILHVTGYSQLNLLLGNGKYIESAKFKVAGHTWRIRCYPNGDREESTGRISVYLELAGESTNVRTYLQFSLVARGKLTKKPHDTASTRATFLSKNACWGFKDFMTNKELEESEYLNDDSFFVRCDLTVLKNAVRSKVRDLETLQLLCDCNNDLCNNFHVKDKEAAVASRKPSSLKLIRNLLLGCVPVRAQ